MVHQIKCEELERIKREQDVMIIDIRDRNSYLQGHIEYAIHIDNEVLQIESAKQLEDYFRNKGSVFKNKRLVVYCESGGRSVYFVKYLLDCGYDAMSLAGGYRAYQKMKNHKN